MIGGIVNTYDRQFSPAIIATNEQFIADFDQTCENQNRHSKLLLNNAVAKYYQY